jgi:MraZ protein
VQKWEEWVKISIKWEKVVRRFFQAFHFYKNFPHHTFPAGICMIIGQFNHRLDDKNRLSLPAKFRQEMGKKVVITPGLDSCLFIFTMKQWGKISESLSMGEGSMLQADNRGFNRYLLGGAVEVEVDAVGRMLLPDHLRTRAKLKDKVVFLGVMDRAELWDEETWNAYRQSIENNANTLAEKLGRAGMI